MSSFLCCFRQKKSKTKNELTKSIATIKQTPLFARSSTLENHVKLIFQDTQPEDIGRRQGKFYTLTTKKVKRSHPLSDYVYPRTLDHNPCAAQE